MYNIITSTIEFNNNNIYYLEIKITIKTTLSSIFVTADRENFKSNLTNSYLTQCHYVLTDILFIIKRAHPTTYSKPLQPFKYI